MMRPGTAFVIVMLATMLFSCANLQAEFGRSDSGYCGLYCVHTAFQDLGLSVHIKDLLKPDYISSQRGSSAKELVSAIEINGAGAVAYSHISILDLYFLGRPTILHSGYPGSSRRNHWILLRGFNADGNAVVYDSNDSNRTAVLTAAQLLSRWDGAAIVISSRNHLPPTWVVAAVHSLVIGNLLLVCLALQKWIHRRRKLCPGQLRSGSFVGFAKHSAAAIVSIIGFNMLPMGMFNNYAVIAAITDANKAGFFDRIEFNEVKSLIHSSTSVLIDVRPASQFSTATIPGSIRLSIDLKEAELQNRLLSLPRDRRLVVFCSSESCPYATEMASKLDKNGFRLVSIYHGGWHDWIINQNAVETED